MVTLFQCPTSTTRERSAHGLAQIHMMDAHGGCGRAIGESSSNDESNESAAEHWGCWVARYFLIYLDLARWAWAPARRRAASIVSLPGSERGPI